ncbi:aminotransferase class I and II [Actinomadura darangshiensis]|uniref:Aminotransferase class I and II n=1 Tax=Actinomadura darangshiensis TaxID=705336 RepID=A0A4R5BCF7_9ACTN|nr:HipA family kinase [Actinomadura darangshiensis]TDD83225.1 aminotransferase class I and II [Actinomadura darangshiensis]
MLPHVTAIRYVTPLREGGSLPGVVEADDLGTYVMKFHGAGQGRKALIAEVIAGELARRLGLRVPDQVLIDLDPAIGRHEPDPDVQDLLKASPGWNLGVDFLPGSLGFDPLGWSPDPGFASRVLWFDAFIGNVDRSWRNPNMLVWHGDVWLIDHGASLIFHHAWANAARLFSGPYDVDDHVLTPYAAELEAAEAELAPKITERLLREVIGLVPDRWLEGEPAFAGPAALRDAYLDILLPRAGKPREWLPALDVSGHRPDTSARRGENRPGWLGGAP